MTLSDSNDWTRWPNPSVQGIDLDVEIETIQKEFDYYDEDTIADGDRLAVARDRDKFTARKRGQVEIIAPREFHSRTLVGLTVVKRSVTA